MAHSVAQWWHLKLLVRSGFDSPAPIPVRWSRAGRRESGGGGGERGRLILYANRRKKKRPSPEM
jgi:hypothetical protein